MQIYIDLLVFIDNLTPDDAAGAKSAGCDYIVGLHGVVSVWRRVVGNHQQKQTLDESSKSFQTDVIFVPLDALRPLWLQVQLQSFVLDDGASGVGSDSHNDAARERVFAFLDFQKPFIVIWNSASVGCHANHLICGF